MLKIVTVFHDARLDHFAQQVIPLAGTLTHTGEHGETPVTFRDVVDQFLNQNGLTHTRTAKETDLTALGIGFDQVDHLDTREQHFRGRAQVLEQRGFGMDGSAIDLGHLGQAVDGIAGHVEQSSVDRFARGHRDRLAGIHHGHSAGQAFGTVHCNGTHTVLSKVLLHFKDQFVPVGLGDLQGIVNVRERTMELNVDYRTDDLFDLTLIGHIKILFNSRGVICRKGKGKKV